MNARTLLVAALSCTACGRVADRGSPGREPPEVTSSFAGPSPIGGFDPEGRWVLPGDPLLDVPVVAWEAWRGVAEVRVSADLEPVWKTSPAEQLRRTFGPEPMTLVLGLGSGGTAAGGTATWGDAAALPPAADEASEYPPGVTSPGAWLRVPFTGRPYRLHDVVAGGSALHFAVTPGELWDDWCALQTSYAVGGDLGYACVPDAAPAAPDAPFRELACAGSPDERACDCDAAGCVANTAYPVFVELTMDGDVASGQVVGFENYWSFWLRRVDGGAPP